MSDVLIPGTPVRTLARTGRGVVVELDNGRVHVLWERPSIEYNINTSVLEVDPDGPVFDWLHPPAPAGSEWVLLDDSVIHKLWVAGDSPGIDFYINSQRFVELNPVPPVVIKPGMWVTPRMRQATDAYYLTAMIGSYATGWMWQPDDEAPGWKPVQFANDRFEAGQGDWRACADDEIPTNAGELLALLGEGGEQ